jgi:vacuolar-type H+-ATPase subunit H
MIMAGTSRIPDKARDSIDSMKETAHQATEQAKDKAQNLTSAAADATKNVVQRAEDMASAAKQKADDTISNVGDKMTALADTLRERAPSGVLGSAAGTVAGPLEAGGHYLQEHGLGDMAEDLNGLIHRYPVQSLCAGLMVGFLLGRTFSRG